MGKDIKHKFFADSEITECENSKELLLVNLKNHDKPCLVLLNANQFTLKLFSNNVSNIIYYNFTILTFF